MMGMDRAPQTAPRADRLRRCVYQSSEAVSKKNPAMELMRTEKYAHPFYWAPFLVVGGRESDTVDRYWSSADPFSAT